LIEQGVSKAEASNYLLNERMLPKVAQNYAAYNVQINQTEQPVVQAEGGE
jgi:hypothetical protein